MSVDIFLRATIVVGYNMIIISVLRHLAVNAVLSAKPVYAY